MAAAAAVALSASGPFAAARYPLRWDEQSILEEAEAARCCRRVCNKGRGCI